MNVEELRQAIRQMTRRSKLYKVLKEELQAQGYWKCKARGNPQAGYDKVKGMLSKG